MSNSTSESPNSETKSRICEIGMASTQNQEKKEVVKCKENKSTFFLPAEILQIPVWGHTPGVGVQGSDRLKKEKEKKAIFIFGLKYLFISTDPCSLCHMVADF